MLMSIEPPLLINDNIFSDIRDEETFKEFILQDYIYEAGISGFRPGLLASSMHDAYKCYIQDTERLNDNMKTSSPDHFKQAGVLAFWLRRFRLVYTWIDIDISVTSPEQKKMREIYVDYGNEYLAFCIGFKICRDFEELKNLPHKLPKLEHDYVMATCYSMKYKSTSPHSMGGIYRSLFCV